MRLIYNLLIPVAILAAKISGAFLPKMREAIDGRKGWKPRFREFDNRISPVWFHVASVGEYEQAKPVITAIGKHSPEIPVVITFSSPSGFHFARRKELLDGSSNIVFVDYLPFDSVGNMKTCFELIRPRLLVLVKFDLWPNQIWCAHDSEVPVILIDATLSPTSKRLSGAGRRFYRSVYNAITRILAISDEDAARFRDSLTAHAHISVAGDTRFDRVVERWRNRGDTGFVFPQSPANNDRVLIAGSTWPQDEVHLLPALGRILKKEPRVRVIIAPHEPTADHVEPLRAWAKTLDMPVATSSDSITEDTRVVIIDTVGILAEAYRFGDVAYIGGSFSTGVHSVIEPAIAGLPVVFGPTHQNSFEAVQLVEQAGGFTVADEAAMGDILHRLLVDEAFGSRAGTIACDYVTSELGATEKCMEAITEYL